MSITQPEHRPPHLINALADLDRDDYAEHDGLTAPTMDGGDAFRSEQVDPAPPARRQPGLALECFVTGHEPYPFTVTVLNPDRLRYEKAAARHKEWPTGTSFVTTFCTWAAARREGKTTLTFEQWEQALEDWEKVADAGTDPTQ